MITSKASIDQIYPELTPVSRNADIALPKANSPKEKPITQSCKKFSSVPARQRRKSTIDEEL